MARLPSPLRSRFAVLILDALKIAYEQILLNLPRSRLRGFSNFFIFFFLVFDYRSILKKSKITLGEFNFSFILKLDERWKFNNRSDKNKKIHAVVVTVVS